MKKLAFLFTFVLYLTVALPAVAASDWQRSGPIEGRLISSVDHIGSTQSVTLGLQVRLDEGWKTYWRTPGDAGLPPDVNWKESTNVKEAELLYPAPYRFTLLGFDNFGYEDAVTFPLNLTVAKENKTTVLKPHINLLVCSDICIAETLNLSLTLPAGVPQPTAEAHLISDAIKALPQELNTDLQLKILRDGINLTLPFSITDIFVETPLYLPFRKPVQQSDGSFFISLDPNTIPEESLKTAIADQEMTLTFTTKEGNYETRFIPADIMVEPSTSGLGLLTILGFALLGGLILNLMPCVLPVLSLKLLSVVSHSSSGLKEIRKGFLASAAGIIFSFLVIASFLVFFKQAGAAIGWGVQFQHPGFLIFLICVVLIFASNLWGLFEISLPRFITKKLSASKADEPTLTGHFLTGALATLLATPCTAPFLGTAVGFALSQGITEIYLVFTALGVGLAGPYFLVALAPQIAQFFPKPGQWMISFKRLLAFALLCTALWLGYVLLNVLDMDKGQTALTQGQEKIDWVTFDQSQIAEHIKNNQTVLVDVTADWCLTCQVNKKFVLESKDVLTHIKENNPIMMRADWTEPDDQISTYLKRYNRYGIPFNIVYGPNAPKGIILPELLSKQKTIDAFEKAAKK